MSAGDQSVPDLARQWDSAVSLSLSSPPYRRRGWPGQTPFGLRMDPSSRSVPVTLVQVSNYAARPVCYAIRRPLPASVPWLPGDLAATQTD